MGEPHSRIDGNGQVAPIGDRTPGHRGLTEPEQLAIGAIKEAGAALELALSKYCQPCRETSLAVTNAQQAIMWAVKGITG